MSQRILRILSREQQLRASLAAAPDGRPLAHLIFFEPDSWMLPDGYEQLLDAHARYMLERPGTRAVISGHSYGSGSHRFYWLMGDRRAIEVQKRLLRLGVDARQLLVQSKGAARSAIETVSQDFGRWRRRAAINYIGADGNAAALTQPGSAEWWRSVFGRRSNQHHTGIEPGEAPGQPYGQPPQRHAQTGHTPPGVQMQ